MAWLRRARPRLRLGFFCLQVVASEHLARLLMQRVEGLPVGVVMPVSKWTH